MTSERIALDKLYKRRDRYQIPEWQREKVWPKAKQQKLIDSILRGWKLPKFYFLLAESSPKEYEVLDGQQRLNAIWDFFEGTLGLSMDSQATFGVEHYADLPDKLSDAFDDYEIDYDSIEDASDEEQKEFFQRLQEGLPLTSSEKLNSVHSKLRDYCASLAKHKFFSETTRVSTKRYGYFDICAKVTALELEGLDSGTRFDDLKKVFEQQASFSGNSAIAKRVKKALDILHKQLPGAQKQLRNRTIVQSIITFCCQLQVAGLKSEQYEILAKFVTHFLSSLAAEVERGQAAADGDYVNFQRTVNANVRSGARTRNNILTRKLLQYAPSFYSDIPQTNSLTMELKDQVADLSQKVGQAIYEINVSYGGAKGQDLFKPTNKTLKALTNGISNVVVSYEAYKTFVEHLYFIFREGVGTRLGADIPTSFADVNNLRTLNEHDIDHGKSTKVAKQRRELAKVFEKYAGEKSPLAVDPGKFTIVQCNVLAALELDLRVLLKSKPWI